MNYLVIQNGAKAQLASQASYIISGNVTGDGSVQLVVGGQGGATLVLPSTTKFGNVIMTVKDQGVLKGVHNLKVSKGATLKLTSSGANEGTHMGRCLFSYLDRHQVVLTLSCFNVFFTWKMQA